MKKISVKKILLKILIVMLFLTPTIVNAGRGCCSHHGGQSYCGSNERWICSDGWQSSCSCYKTDYDSSSTNQNIGSDYLSSDSTDDSGSIVGAILSILLIFSPFAIPMIYDYLKNIYHKKIKNHVYNETDNSLSFTILVVSIGFIIIGMIVLFH